MGRGRQKAKHMKVARRLKYYSPETDLDALQRELTGSDDPELSEESEDEDDDWEATPWDPQPDSYSNLWDEDED